MKKFLLILLSLILQLTAAGKKGNTDYGVVAVSVTGLKNNQGELFIAVYRNSASFLNKDSIPFLKFKNDIVNLKSEIIFDSLKFGYYAITCFHDENGNGTFDKNMFGMPSEDYGLSNNVKPKFGPPLWKDCKFLLDKDSLFIQIKILN